MNRPLQVGVTGGIGAGKSVVCRIFATLGAPVYDADARARWLTEHDPILRSDITRLLGEEAYDATGHYNRAWVAAQVFADPNLLLQLNALVHPRVWADTQAWVKAHATSPYVVKEAALFREAGNGNTLDKLVVVTAPEPLRIKRTLARDAHRTEADVRAILARQMSDEERSKLADYVLVNDEQQLLLPQVVALHEAFLAMATT